MLLGLALLSVAEAATTASATPTTTVRPSPYRAESGPVLIPAGTTIRIRLNHSVGTKLNRPGERFDATLVSPLMANGRVVVPRGADVHGVVRESRPSGRLKGRAVLSMALESVEVEGRRVPIETVSLARTSDRHRKRNVLFTGGGAGTGAVIGALAGGPVGAAIGAGSGAAAGLTTAFVTGKKQVRIPAETVMSFRLARSVTLPPRS